MIEWKHPNAIVETEWLAENLYHENLRIFDCTTYLRYTEGDPHRPYIVESGRSDYEQNHIDGSAFLDLQGELSIGNSPYRFTLPNYADLARRFSNIRCQRR